MSSYTRDRYFDLRPSDFWAKELNSLWWFHLLLGLSLIGLGVAIVIFPQLLAILVASALIAVGVGIISLGWQVREARDRYRRLKRDVLS